ncbi:hypothetical protein [Thermoactinomyces mirandus]|uniref:hypothetical protein n=1 Tax=Thermoactinomyces mirandus TaxID=2756294 RepID=UPI001FE9DEFA|nr:hypothetical protein [Thermoactinomyces mirandus]
MTQRTAFVTGAGRGIGRAIAKTLAKEMARYKLNINCVAPGPSDTPLFQEIGSYNWGIAEALLKVIPFRQAQRYSRCGCLPGFRRNTLQDKRFRSMAA